MNEAANIVAWDNASGLGRDVDVLARALTDSGWTVAFNGSRTRRKKDAISARVLRRLGPGVRGAAVRAGLAGPPYEWNLHLEDLGGKYLSLAARNVLIPNQEWFREPSSRHLARADEVWAKTRFAEQAFAELGCKVRYLGWTGTDRSMPNARAPGSLSALHIAGASAWKGTEALLDVWSDHPEWPVLRVLRRTHDNWGFVMPWRFRERSANIEIITDSLDDDALRRLQNASAIHVCPSEAEGFGHILVEGMSVGAVIIATDAPPMNEIVTSERGLLAAADRSEPMGLGRRYFVSRKCLARSIAAALRMSEPERESLGRTAREWFLANDAAFRRNLLERLGRSPGSEHAAA